MASSDRAPRRLRHVPALDGLRGLAVILVATSHLTILIPRHDITGVAFVDDFVRGGYLGVDLFFVLSGFLITALLLNEVQGSGRVGFRSFYARRGLRLLPALYLMLLVFAFYTVATGLPWEPAWESIRAAVLYYFNWFIVHDLLSVAPGTGHLWSLAIEEQFYLVWPAVLVGLLRLKQSARVVTGVLTAGIVLVALNRFRLYENGTSWIDLIVRTDTRADSLLVGALLATLWVRRLTPERGLDVAASVGAVGLLLYATAVAPDAGFSHRGGTTLFALGAGVIVLAVVKGTWGGTGVLEARALQTVGRVSYGVYLWHLPVFFAVARYGATWPEWSRLGVALGLTAAFTALSWWGLERPAQTLRHRFRPSKASATTDPNLVQPPTGDAGGPVPISVDQRQEAPDPDGLAPGSGADPARPALDSPSPPRGAGGDG